MTEIGFIGLGDLGAPIAANLLAAGYGLRVHNRTQSKADALVARGAERAARPADAVVQGGVLMTLLWDGASVEEVVGSEDFLDRLGAGGVHVSMTTMAPETSQALAALHARHGSHLIEAPIFGRPEAAAARGLWVPVAGPAAAKARVRPLLEAMGAQGVFDFGETIGSALTVKLAGNFLIMSAAASLTEALGMAKNRGADVAAVVDMLTNTLFPAPVYQSYGKLVASGTPTFNQSAIPAKDLGLFQQAAETAETAAPIAAMLLARMRDA
ncbi:NAD(P)-dependent oxidoreductase [Sphingomonas bacterium]|uniref:NAD(P)-dependent oxidoreductase n=1 Tax=Sphingomonas bacterium TaxID=1895847 RepID=UPI0015773A32|nr:NAD(P)-dependent oxidoreductase [Sphingomonas bacterium]